MAQAGADTGRIDAQDTGATVGAVGQDTRLLAGEAASRHPQLAERHRHQCAGDDLTGGEQQVQATVVIDIGVGGTAADAGRSECRPQ